MHLAVRHLALPIVASTIAGACVSPSESSLVNIPPGAKIYVIAPQLLSNEFIDTTGGQSFALTWLVDLGFEGYSCFGFSPSTPTDTVGTFVFGRAGPNDGWLQRRANGLVDTVRGYFIDAQLPGTHGSYVVESSGKLTLNWSDGTRTRYFAPSAVLRMTSDTVESTVDLRASADSIRDQWHVFWINSPGCP